MAHPGPADDENEEDASASPSALKSLMHYVMLGFAPFVAALALMFALISIVRVPAMQVKVGNADARMKKLETDLNSSRAELKKLKDVLQREQTVRAQNEKKHNRLAAQIVHDVTQLQTKLKIHPTLKQRLKQARAVSAVPTTAAASAASTTNGEPTGQAKAMLEAIKQFNSQQSH